MSLTAGSRLGPYEILSPLGAGGMGEVYRARDTKLDREVAIKVLPESFARDPERVARFEREAKLLATLNHTNIAAIHGFDEANGTRFLVMEYVEGETLAQRLKSGAFAVEDALDVAKQMAEALEAAHEKGVIHRDLKPGNVMIRSDGSVKVLDFGLAKAMAEEPSPSTPADSPTITANYTRPGVVLGTAAYMSPEQARGKRLDKRTDIWSFGCVFYECLTGTKPFVGETTSDIVARILEREPDWAPLPPQTPPVVQLLLRRCLAKDRDRRLHDIGDARVEIQEAIADPTSSSLSLAGAAVAQFAERDRTTRTRRLLPWALATIFLFVSVALGMLLLNYTPNKIPVIRAEIAPPAGSVFNLATIRPGPPSISPDGRVLAFTALDPDGLVRLYVRSLDATESIPLSGTEGAAYPFWSPNSRSIGFHSDGKLKRIDAGGGAPLILCTASNMKGGTWNRDGTIVFAPSHNTPLHRVPDTGGPSTPITELDFERGDNSHRHPRFLPDGRHFLYLARIPKGGVQGYAVLVRSLDGAEEELLLRSPAAAQFASGNLLYLRGRTLMAQPFDPSRLEMTNDPGLLATDVTSLIGAGVAIFTASDDGILIYQIVQGDSEGDRLEWFARDGIKQGQLGDPASFGEVSISPDNKRIVVYMTDESTGTADLWVYDAARGIPTRFTFDPGNDLSPVWTPDGGAIIFSSNRGAQYDLYRRALDQPAEPELLLESAEAKIPSSCSPDGKLLVYSQTNEETLDDVWILPLTGDRKPFAFIQTRFAESDGKFSPDGQWMAYTSEESGRAELYITSFPNRKGTTQVSTHGAAHAWWRNDGKEIIYQNFPGELIAVEILLADNELEIGSATSLFKAPPPSTIFPSICPTPDAKRFLAITQSVTRTSTPLTLTLNWTAELNKP